MARVLLIFSTIFVLAAAGLGVMARQKVTALQDDLSTTKSKLASTEKDLGTTKKDLKDTKTELEQTTQALEEAKSEASKAKSDLSVAQSELATAKAEVADKSAKLADIQEKLDKVAGNGVDPALIGEKITELQAEKTRLETELAEARQVEATLNSRVASLDENLAKSNAKVAEYKGNFVKPGLTGTVLSYNPGWNFVVLSIGDRAGLKSGVQMVIARGGTLIGKVRVTSVEPNSAIADVLPSTLPEGVQIQPGDRVMYQGAH